MANTKEKSKVKLTHDLYSTIGKTLYEGIRSGRLNPKALQSLSANINVDLGRNYGLNLDYSGRKKDLKLKLTYDF